MTITVTRVEREDDWWIVHFARGTVTTEDDETLFLSRTNDYCQGYDELKAGAVMMPFAEDLERARAKAAQRRISPQQEALRNMAGESETLRESLASMKARVLVKRAQRNLEAAARLLSEESLSSVAHVAADGSPSEAGRPPSDVSQASPQAA